MEMNISLQFDSLQTEPPAMLKKLLVQLCFQESCWCGPLGNQTKDAECLSVCWTLQTAADNRRQPSRLLCHSQKC